MRRTREKITTRRNLLTSMKLSEAVIYDAAAAAKVVVVKILLVTLFVRIRKYVYFYPLTRATACDVLTVLTACDEFITFDNNKDIL